MLVRIDPKNVPENTVGIPLKPLYNSGIIADIDFLRGDAKAMCYLAAKKFSETGCLAVKAESGKALANLVSYLGLKTLDRGIQIFTVSDMEAYGEYKPYKLVKSEKEFISQVLDM